MSCMSSDLRTIACGLALEKYVFYVFVIENMVHIFNAAFWLDHCRRKLFGLVCSPKSSKLQGWVAYDKRVSHCI